MPDEPAARTTQRDYTLHDRAEARRDTLTGLRASLDKAREHLRWAAAAKLPDMVSVSAVAAGIIRAELRRR